jgi:F-type H+-transporting ATPase subunit a
MQEPGHPPPPPQAEELDIIGHVANSPPDHPLIHLPPVFGIDLSISKHVFMLWLVAGLLFLLITTMVRRYIRQPRLVPTGSMNALEFFVEFIRDSVARPNLGAKWTPVWTPLLLSFFFFILGANVIGLIPIFDVLGLVNHYVFHGDEHSFLTRLVHGSATATGNPNVTAGLAVISFFTIIIAGVRAHGFVQHWVNLVPHGLPKPIYILLIPMEIVGMFVRPFALMARLAANMTGGHIALLAITSIAFIFANTMGTAAGIGVGLLFSVPLNVGILGLEVIVVLVQAFVFTLLSAVFIGMAIHAHH